MKFLIKQYRMNILHIFIMLMPALVLFSVTTKAEAVDYSEIMANFNKRLAAHCSHKDSIHILTNMMDIAQIYPEIYKPDSIAGITYYVAIKNKDYATANEMLRVRANSWCRNIDSLNVFRERAKAHPVDKTDDETITFIEMQRNSYYTFNANEEKREKRFDENLKKLIQNPPENIYQQIYLLHAICLHLYSESNGELMIKYFEDLNRLVNQLPADSYSLRNLVMVQTALALSLAGEREKAIEADRKLLALVDELKDHYVAIGRPYRSYEANKYVFYTRLLSAWENLKPEEIKEYYDASIDIVENDSRAANTYRAFPLPEYYYAAFRKDYHKMVDIVREKSINKIPSYRKPEILRTLITAAKNVGDSSMLHIASEQYIKHLENIVKHTSRDSELQVLYETHRVQEQMSKRELERQEEVNRMQRIFILISIAAILILVILLIFLKRQNQRNKELTKRLLVSNETLKSESCALRASQREVFAARDSAKKANEFKTDFIRSLAHEVGAPFNAITEYAHLLVDCSDTSKKPYLEQYAQIISNNIEFLNAMIRDVFHLSEIDSDSVTIVRRLSNVRKIINLSIDNLTPSLHPGVKIEVNPNAKDIDTFTDPSRIHQILKNVLENAVRVTTSGTIYFDYYLINGDKDLAIVISDTGPGIPQQYKESIFERFFKIHETETGAGLGLPISRLIARLMGGDLVLDTTYTHGARFILTIPYSVK